MFRVLNGLKNLSLDISPVINDSFNLISVRWRRNPRKPIWKGTAKSKIFRVPVKPKIPEEERLELFRLYNNYRTEVKSITRYLTSKYNVQNQQEDDEDLKKKEFEADLAACMKLNDEWNAKQKILREARVTAELEDAIKLAHERKSATQDRRLQRLKEAEEIVKREKELSKHFILPEMLDAEIEKALANPVDHNFALNLDGNKIIGRETQATNEKKIEKIRQ